DGDRIYLSGHGLSNNGLATPGSHQPLPGGQGDAFLAAFDTSGQRLWTTWFGGAGEDGAYGVAAANGHVHITGWTESTTSISTPGAQQGTFGGWVDAF